MKTLPPDEVTFQMLGVKTSTMNWFVGTTVQSVIVRKGRWKLGFAQEAGQEVGPTKGMCTCAEVARVVLRAWAW